MIPIHELLARIRWDGAFGRASFVIGYWDRVVGTEVKVPLERVHVASGQHFAFEAIESDGSVHAVPFHRVRHVWRDGRLIWSRPRSD